MTALSNGGNPAMGLGLGASPTHQKRDNSNSPVDTAVRDGGMAAHMAGTAGFTTVSPSGATVIDPSVEPSGTLNPRSCVTCRRRKVRCDKRMPCSNCRKAHISCIFPAPGRAPRRPRPKDPNAPPKQTSEREVELMKRLRKLEGIVEELSGQIEPDARHASSTDGSPIDTTNVANDEKRRETSQPTASGHQYSRSDSLRLMRNSSWGPSSAQVQSPTESSGVNRDFGRLVLNDDGKTRYVSNAFWSKMNDELAALRADTEKLTDEDSDESEDDGSTPVTVASVKETQADHHAFLFGYRSCDVDLRKLHPLPSQIPFIWQVYTENIDPLVKILHVPTMNGLIRKLRTNMDILTPGLEALMFSIYFSAITSMEEDEVKRNFNADKWHLHDQYRFATEQALAKAGFLNTSELVVVQALALYVALVRRYDNSRFSWTLTGLLIRIAQALGIHREGTHFASLSPFDIEMRRRLWWAIVVLDLRAAEDQGTDLTIHGAWDTSFPIHINDVDITPEMKDFPPEREGPADLTFCLIRYEICNLARRMHQVANPLSPCSKDTALSLQEREDMLLELYDRVEERYLKPCEDSEGGMMHWLAAAMARIIMAKMSLLIYQPILFSAEGQQVSQQARDRIFTAAIEVIEYNRLLSNEEKSKQYRWLFQTQTHWNAIAYLLLELCRRPWSAPMERAWMALSSTLQLGPSEQAKLQAHTSVLFPIRKLMMKAQKHREAEVTRLRNDPQAAEQLDMEEVHKAVQPIVMFQHLPSSVRNTMAQERWRKLVGRPTLDKQRSKIQSSFNNPAESSVQQAVIPSTTAPEIRSTESPIMPMQQYGYVDTAFAQPELNMADFWTMNYPEMSGLGNTVGLGPSSDVVGQGGASTTPQQTAMPGLPLNGNAMADGGLAFGQQSSASATPNMQQTTRAQATGLTDPLTADTLVDDNPPPWLWPNNGWNWNDQTAVLSSVPVVDDGDVNMDEEFDWQDWQQTIRGFSMDATSGIGGGGFAGGI